MSEFVVRFIVGGLIVSAFSLLGDLVRPKSFAGLFSAAPSVALASLAISIVTKGSSYAALQARSMMFGAAALILFSIFTCQLQMRSRLSAMPATVLSLVLWFAVAVGLHSLFPQDG